MPILKYLNACKSTYVHTTGKPYLSYDLHDHISLPMGNWKSWRLVKQMQTDDSIMLIDVGKKNSYEYRKTKLFEIDFHML